MLGIDAQLGDGGAHVCGFDLAAAGERGERSDGDRGGIHLEVAAQRVARVAAAEAVGTERMETRRDEAGDLIRYRADPPASSRASLNTPTKRCGQEPDLLDVSLTVPAKDGAGPTEDSRCSRMGPRGGCL